MKLTIIFDLPCKERLNASVLLLHTNGVIVTMKTFCEGYCLKSQGILQFMSALEDNTEGTNMLQ